MRTKSEQQAGKATAVQKTANVVNLLEPLRSADFHCAVRIDQLEIGREGGEEGGS